MRASRLLASARTALVVRRVATGKETPSETHTALYGKSTVRRDSQFSDHCVNQAPTSADALVKPIQITKTGLDLANDSGTILVTRFIVLILFS